MKTTQEYLAELQGIRKTIRIALPLCIIGFLLAGLLGVAAQLYLPASVLVAAVLAVYLWYTHHRRSRYLALLNRAAIEHGLCRTLASARYLGRSGLNEREFAAWEILPLAEERGALLCHHAFEGTLGGRRLRGQEVTFHYPAAPTGKRAVCRYVNGTLLTCGDVPTRGGGWLVLHKRLLDPQARQRFAAAAGCREVQPPAELAEDFLVYTWERQEAMSAPTAQRLAELAGKCRALGAVRLAPAGAALFLNDTFYTGGVYGKKEPDEAALCRNNLPEGDAAWAFFRFWNTRAARPA